VAENSADISIELNINLNWFYST